MITTLFQSNPLHSSTCKPYVNLNFVINRLTQSTTKSLTSNLSPNVNGNLWGFWTCVLNFIYEEGNPLKEIELSRLRFDTICSTLRVGKTKYKCERKSHYFNISKIVKSQTSIVYLEWMVSEPFLNSSRVIDTIKTRLTLRFQQYFIWAPFPLHNIILAPFPLHNIIWANPKSHHFIYFASSTLIIAISCLIDLNSNEVNLLRFFCA